MKPTISDAWDSYRLGTYTFKDTVYSRGSTTFSGRFDTPDFAGVASLSRFEGLFTGPGAAELMARWEAPSPFGNMVGVLIGKKD